MGRYSDYDNMPEFQGKEDSDLHRPEPLPMLEVFVELQKLTEEDAVLPVGVIYGLSDLYGEELALFKQGWGKLGTEQRRKTISILSETTDEVFDLDFSEVSYVGLQDPDPQIRENALDLVWYDFSPTTFEAIMRLANDEATTVRAAVMSGLGRFIMAGELAEFDMAMAERAQEVVLRYYDDLREDVDVRRRALEAISHSSHPRVPQMIQESYEHEETLMRASAIFAMGASCDRQWEETVLEELESDAPEIRYEAVRAAGELELERAIMPLTEYAYAEDEEIKIQAIYALAEIGSNEARRVLNDLAALAEESADEDLLDIIADAIDMMMLMDGDFFGLFSYMDDMDAMLFEDEDNGPYLN